MVEKEKTTRTKIDAAKNVKRTTIILLAFYIKSFQNQFSIYWQKQYLQVNDKFNILLFKM